MSANIDIPKSDRSELRQTLLKPSPESVRSSFLSSRIFGSKKKTGQGSARFDSGTDFEDISSSAESLNQNQSDRHETSTRWSGLTSHASKIHVKMEVLSPAQVSAILITLWVSVAASLLFAVYEEQWFRPKFTLNSDSSCYSQFSGRVCANLQGLNCSAGESTIRGMLNGTTPFNGFFSLRGQVLRMRCFGLCLL